MTAMVETLPLIIAGPILRRCTQQQFTVWLMFSREPEAIHLSLNTDDATLYDQTLSGDAVKTVQVGVRAFITLLHLSFDEKLPQDQLIQYQLTFTDAGKQYSLGELIPDLLYAERQHPDFVIKSHLTKVIHGSCRKPHSGCDDALGQLDNLIQENLDDVIDRPDTMIMSGDQIYADDVAGPMLKVIHQTIALLGLTPETWEGASANDTKGLLASDCCYYQRDKLLPANKVNQKLLDLFFDGSQKPIFTTNSAYNHLITLAELVAMYALIWSPTLWDYLDPDDAAKVPEEFLEAFRQQAVDIKKFATGLTPVRRAMAHIPVYMIFDDHDVTDDWNLNRGWEQAAYGHPFSKRIIGNALIAYWLCQGWGNNAAAFETIYESSHSVFDNTDDIAADALIDTLLHFRRWDYSVETVPKIIVADTRTNRWRSETQASSPSGLMDWEALSDLQQELVHHDAVILVSPAPIFGVKLIEVIQRIFSYFGQALMVDAENWMAHNGAGNVILNIFLHPKTPQHFVILSGDVHYSFVYDISLRHREGGPEITQVTASGIKNRFPDKLLHYFDLLDRFLYGRRSPLNWLTKRRRMRVRSRKPEGLGRRRLVNQSNLGILRLDREKNVEADAISASGEIIHFKREQ